MARSPNGRVARLRRNSIAARRAVCFATDGVVATSLADDVRLLPLLLFTLIAALGAAGVLAWRQYAELTVWRAGFIPGERAALEARLEQFRRRNFQLEAELAALQLDKTAAEGSARESAVAKDAAKASATAALAQLSALAANPDGTAKNDETFDLVAAMADTPEFQKLLALEQRGKVDAKFAALFKKLNLSPADQAKLETLLTDRQTAFADAMIAARDQGLTGKDARDLANAVANSTQKQIDGSIKDLLGPQRYGQYQNYEHTLPQRDAVNQLAQQLSYTSTPLTPGQQDRLVQVLATTAAAPKPIPGSTAAPAKAVASIAPLPGALANLGIGSAPSAPITTTAVAQSQSFLSAPQLAALQQMQWQQQAQQALHNVVSGAKSPPKPAPKPGG